MSEHGPRSESRTYESTQSLAAWMVWPTLVVLVAVGVWLASRPDVPQATVWIMGAATVLTGAFFLALGRMRVVVDTEAVRISFPLGWPRKVILLAEVREARSVRLSWWWGWGLRWTPKGWLWRLRGLDAVALEREGARAFHIGVDEPARLLAALRAEGVPVRTDSHQEPS